MLIYYLIVSVLRGEGPLARKGRDRLSTALRWQWRHNRAPFVTWLVLRFLVLVALVRSAMQGYYENVFTCLLVLALFMLPSIIQQRLGVSFPSALQIVILCHIFASEILGELACYYVNVPFWDTIMHTVWGFLCAAVGYALVDILNRNNPGRFHLSPAYLAIVAFCFSMTIGVLWEFIEFAADRLFLMDMQKDTVITQFSSVLLDATHSNIPVPVTGISDVAVNGESLGLGGYLDIGLFDTMEDLFVNFLGAVTFALIGYFDARKHAGHGVSTRFIPRLAEDVADSVSQ